MVLDDGGDRRQTAGEDHVPGHLGDVPLAVRTVQGEDLEQLPPLVLQLLDLGLELDVLGFQGLGFADEVGGALAFLQPAFRCCDFVSFAPSSSPFLVFRR